MLIDDVECQVLDWKVHKMLCSSINEPSPGPEYRRVILFPAEGQQPRLEWMKVWEVDFGEAKYEEWARKAYFGDDPVEMYSVCRNNIQARNTFDDDQNGIMIWISGNACMKSHNEAVRAVTRAGVCAYCWKGPVLAMRKIGQEGGIEGYVDFTVRDLRSIADFFTSSWRKNQYDNANKRLLACMRSSDSMVDRGIPEYRELAIDQANSIFSKTGGGIANLLGIPLLIETVSVPELAQMMPRLTQFRQSSC